MEFQLLKGFHDILPEEAILWQELETKARNVLERHGFKEIRLPILEPAGLFKRSIGEETDIVSKEMYCFKDQKGRELSLRPEATSQVVRAYVQNRLDLKEPVSKLYLIGPMFRHERPQKGRFRQFHQIDVEIIGDPGPITDAETLVLAWELLKDMGIKGLELFVNSLGCDKCRPDYRARLVDYLKTKSLHLCPDCQRRCETNPLRVFDCKQDGCKEALGTAPIISDFLCDGCKHHFEEVKALVKMAHIPFKVNPMLVRGLDYYTRTAFEITSDALGAQNAVAGGGRYDNLIGYLGGPPKPAIGFAIGMERALEILREEGERHSPAPYVFIVGLGERARQVAFSLLLAFRKQGIRAEMGYQDTSLKSQLKQADKQNVRYAVIIGENELSKERALLRDMKSSTQREVNLGEVVRIIRNTLGE